MNKTSFAPAFAALVVSSLVHASSAESIVQPLNDPLWGTLSGRVQFLGMQRDYDHGLNGYNGTLGTVIGYESPRVGGFDFGGFGSFGGGSYGTSDSYFSGSSWLGSGSGGGSGGFGGGGSFKLDEFGNIVAV